MSESIRTAAAPHAGIGEVFTPRRRLAAPRPTAREWVRHAAFFLATLLTTTFAGVLLAAESSAAPALADPVSWSDYLIYPLAYYVSEIAGTLAAAATDPALLVEGATFSVALLAILLAHEAGHYVACRRYGVDATLPFFIPAPPPLLAGTLGAFIKIRSPIPSRRALFDIGVAGPLAGFAVVIPVALAGLLVAAPRTTPLPADGVIITFHDPLLLRVFAGALGVDLGVMTPNPFYLAAWIGLLVTSLNLLPVGQLDGGHAVYALFGRRAHNRVSRLAFLSMLLLAPLGLVWHGTPGGFIYALLLLIMLRLRHPEAEEETDALGPTRAAVAAITLAVFLLSFWPFPVTIG